MLKETELLKLLEPCIFKHGYASEDGEEGIPIDVISIDNLKAIILSERLIISRPLDTQVMQKARLFTKAKIRLLGQKEAKILPITNITFRDNKVYSVTVEYPLGNNYYDYLTYYFDGRKIGECKDIDVNEIFEGFSA